MVSNATETVYCNYSFIFSLSSCPSYSFWIIIIVFVIVVINRKSKTLTCNYHCNELLDIFMYRMYNNLICSFIKFKYRKVSDNKKGISVNQFCNFYCQKIGVRDTFGKFLKTVIKYWKFELIKRHISTYVHQIITLSESTFLTLSNAAVTTLLHQQQPKPDWYEAKLCACLQYNFINFQTQFREVSSLWDYKKNERNK